MWSWFVTDQRGLMSQIRKIWQRVGAKVTRNYDYIQHDSIDEKHETSKEAHSYVQSPGRRLGVRLSTGLLYATIRTLSLLWYLIPRRGVPIRRKAVHELHPLSYLDALRGWLALIIFTAHTMSRNWKWLPKSMLEIPWLQFPFRGGFASLDIFFWISGYAITYRIVGFMHAKRADKALDALTSSVFRRYFRLFLPTLPVTLLTVVAVRTGIAIPPKEKADVIKGNFFLWWLKDAGHMMNPFTHFLGWWDADTGSKLLDPFWSLNAEFRSSMSLFVFCVGTCKMPASKRKLVIWLCIPAFIIWQVQWAAMAFLGMWFAECRQQRVQEQKAQLSLGPTTTEPASGAQPAAVLGSGHGLVHKGTESLLQHGFASISSRLSRARAYWITLRDEPQFSRSKTLALYLLFLYSFVVLMNPYDMDKKTNFPNNLLNAITIEHWHPQTDMHLHLCVGAFMMLYPLDRLYPLQRPLLSPLSQYLGELSFGIYAVHFPVRWIVWEPRYVKWASDRYGSDKYDTFRILFPGYMFMMICVLWAADAFRRFDMQVVKFCKYLETQFFE